MDSRYYSNTGARKVDVKDIILEWLIHWRSLVFALIVAIGVGFLIILHSAENVEMTAKETDHELSGFQVSQVEECVAFYNEYCELKSNVNTNRGELSDLDRVSILNEMIASYRNLKDLEKELTIQQLDEYHKLIGFEDVTEIEKSVNAQKNGFPTKNLETFLLCVICSIIIHFFIIVIPYIYNNKLKYYDDLESMIGCTVIARIVEGEIVKNKKGISRFAAHHRIGRYGRINYKDAVALCANTISDIIERDNVSSIAIICGNMDSEAEELKNLIEVGKDKSINVIDSLLGNVENASMLSGMEGAIMLARVNDTDIRDLTNEINSIYNRRIPLIGTVVYVNAQEA